MSKINLRLANIISIIPETSENEAIMAIETIVAIPFSLKLRLSCNLSSQFIIFLTAECTSNNITIIAEGYKNVITNDFRLLSDLKKYIYELDAAIAEGFNQPRREVFQSFPNPPPSGMDIPVWDDKRKVWYDAEY